VACSRTSRRTTRVSPQVVRFIVYTRMAPGLLANDLQITEDAAGAAGRRVPWMWRLRAEALACLVFGESTGMGVAGGGRKNER
jgi:hypothetical protein